MLVQPFCQLQQAALTALSLLGASWGLQHIQQWWAMPQATSKLHSCE